MRRLSKKERVEKFNRKQSILGADYRLGYDEIQDTVNLVSCDTEMLILPDYVDYISLNACANSRRLRKFVGGANLANIGLEAFLNCFSLKEVDLSKCDKLTSLHSGVFSGCRNLEKFKFPKNISRIYNSFCGCYKLSMHLPNELGEGINGYGLAGTIENDVINLSKLKVSGKAEKVKFKTVEIDSEYSESMKFYGCEIENLIIKNTGILKFREQFKNCIIKSVTYEGNELPGHFMSGCEIGEMVCKNTISISTMAIGECTISSLKLEDAEVFASSSLFNNKINKMVLGNRVKNIGSYAFANCDLGIDTELFNQKYLTNIGESAFSAVQLFDSYTGEKIKKIHFQVGELGCCDIGDRAFGAIRCDEFTISGNYNLKDEVFMCCNITKIVLDCRCELIGEEILKNSKVGEIYLPKSLKCCSSNILGSFLTRLHVIGAPKIFFKSLSIYGVELIEV